MCMIINWWYKEIDFCAWVMFSNLYMGLWIWSKTLKGILNFVYKYTFLLKQKPDIQHLGPDKGVEHQFEDVFWVWMQQHKNMQTKWQQEQNSNKSNKD